MCTGVFGKIDDMIWIVLGSGYCTSVRIIDEDTRENSKSYPHIRQHGEVRGWHLLSFERLQAGFGDIQSRRHLCRRIMLRDRQVQSRYRVLKKKTLARCAERKSWKASLNAQSEVSNAPDVHIQRNINSVMQCEVTTI